MAGRSVCSTRIAPLMLCRCTIRKLEALTKKLFVSVISCRVILNFSSPPEVLLKIAVLNS